MANPIIKDNLFLRDNKKLYDIPQFEYNCRDYVFTLHDADGYKIDLTNCTQAAYLATKEDGNVLGYELSFDIENSTVTYTPPLQATTCKGRVTGVIELQFSDRVGNLRYYGVNFNVQRTIQDAEIESTTDFRLLDILIAEAKKIIEEGLPPEQIEKITEEVKKNINLDDYEKTADVDEKLTHKQDTLVAGDNVTIEDNVISAEETEFNNSVAKNITQDNVDSWNNKADKSTTLAGYGITDAYTKTEIDEQFQVVNPTIDVETIEGGHKVTVTDKEGSESFDVMDGKDGHIGVDGKSAYEIAVEQGYIGTETEWLESLKGQDGVNGVDGTDGFSPTVTTTQTESGAEITITDVSGDKTVILSNGKDGTNGADGQNGFSPILEVQEQTDETYILSLTDSTHTITTPNLKGAKGDTYVLTQADKEDIAELAKYDDTQVKVDIQTNATNIEILDTKVQDLQLYKFPNATIHGEPTINNGQISGFSEHDYLQFPFIVDFKNRPFQIDFEITTGNNITSQQNIIDSDFGLAIAIRNGRFVTAMSTNGTSWDLGEGIGTHPIQPNSNYRIRLVWNGSVYVLSYSVDGGESYITDITINSTSTLYPKQIYIGVGSTNGVILNSFDGTINFNYCSLIISDKVVWTGMDDVGLASRMAVDMSNIDNAGRQAINDIVTTNPTVVQIQTELIGVSDLSYDVNELSNDIEDIVNAIGEVIG